LGEQQEAVEQASKHLQVKYEEKESEKLEESEEKDV